MRTRCDSWAIIGSIVRIRGFAELVYGGLGRAFGRSQRSISVALFWGASLP
jgi:hypothetical protein